MRKAVIYICFLIILGCVVYFAGELTGYPVSRFFDSFSGDVYVRGISDADAAGEEQYLRLKRELAFEREMYPYLYMLSESGQKAYYIIYDGVSRADKTIQIDTDIGISRIEIMTVVTALYNDHPELFWMDCGATYTYDENTGIVVSISPQYNDLANNLNRSKSEFKANADAILGYANRLTDSSDLAKEVYVHDCLCEVCVYDESATNHQSAYSCLVEGRSVCSGYSRAFQYLMQQLHISTYLVVGDIISGGPHAWNMITINGNSYNVDVTWDDSVGEQMNDKCHAFFNVSDNDISATHKRDHLSLNLSPCPYDDMSYSKAVGHTVTIDQIKMAPPAK